MDSLCRYTPASDLSQMQIVFVDAQLWGIGTDVANRYFRAAGKFALADPQWHNWARREELEMVVRGRFKFLHIPPKPSSWQGPFRFTHRDWFAASNARNTALIVADKPYFAGVDDLSILAPTWVDNIRHAASSGYVACGMYKKLLEMEVRDGELVKFQENEKGVDSRWGAGSETGIVPWYGTGMYGCSFGVPTQLAVDIDGFDYYCDGMGAEDYDFGIRLERAGAKFFLNKNLLTWESEEGHWEEQSLPRESYHVPHDRLPQSLKADYPNGLMSDHVMLQSVVRETTRTLPLGRATVHSLASLRAQWKNEALVSIPEPSADVDWRTGKSLSALEPETIEL